MLREWIETYAEDVGSLERAYAVPLSRQRRERMERFQRAWMERLDGVDVASLAGDDRVDHLLLQNHVRHALSELALERRLEAEVGPLLPFAPPLVELLEDRRRHERADGRESARRLTVLTQEISACLGTRPAEGPADGARAVIAHRAADVADRLRALLREWFDFYRGYDPELTWWASLPHQEAERALEGYARFLREEVAGAQGAEGPIIGTPIGADALMAELDNAMIAYTPDELVAIARCELDWCREQAVRAARELGYGDDWRAAIEHVKTLHVPPGDQPEAIYALAYEGVDYAEAHDLVTVPPLVKETWRAEMMSPERQLVNPFFLGGEVIRISYPTDTMTYDQRLMSMRGNNIPFSRSTVFHELIPGHYLQQFMSARHRPYRRLFRTPFWSEGNAFYWEMVYWDLGFPRTPEERLGMLFWRMHRSARVIYTLGFHLGRMTPEESVDLLVNDVGHEVQNARGEVRRLFEGRYGPIYQCAYLIGALQFRALRREVVSAGVMNERAFHDAILEQNHMPIAVLRAILTGRSLDREEVARWRFYDPPAPPPEPGEEPAALDRRPS